MVAADHAMQPEENSILETETQSRALQPPMIEAVTPDRVIARSTAQADAPPSTDHASLASDQGDGMTEEAKRSPKHDWI